MRYRHLDSDFFRIARQQQFLRGIKQRATDFPLLDLPKLVKTLTSNVEVGKGDGTRFDARTLLDYAALVYGLPPRHVIQSRIDLSCYQGLNEVTVPESCIQTAVNDFIQPDVDAPLKATDVALEPSPRRSAPAPSQTTVTVLNGNGQVGSATSAASQLGARGYKIVTSGDGERAELGVLPNRGLLPGRRGRSRRGEQALEALRRRAPPPRSRPRSPRCRTARR